MLHPSPRSEHHATGAMHTRVNFALRAQGLTVGFCLGRLMLRFVQPNDLLAALVDGEGNSGNRDACKDQNDYFHPFNIGTVARFFNASRGQRRFAARGLCCA